MEVVLKQLRLRPSMKFKKSDIISYDNENYIVLSIHRHYSVIMSSSILEEENMSNKIFPKIKINNIFLEKFKKEDSDILFWHVGTQNNTIKKIIENYLNEKNRQNQKS